MIQKGIVVVSFGTAYPEALKRAMEPIEKLLEEKFPEFRIYRAFTSKQVRAQIANRGDVVPLSLEEVVEQMKAEGIGEAFVQPLQFVPGEEYQKARQLVDRLREENKFASIKLGRTFLHFNGQVGKSDDFAEVANCLGAIMPPLGEGEGMIWMAHGSTGAANGAYELLGYRLNEQDKSVFLATLEGGPSISQILPKLRERRLTKLHLTPFLWIAGGHAFNDMAGEGENSWKSFLEKEGFKVECHLKGLGEWPIMRELVINRAQKELKN